MNTRVLLLAAAVVLSSEVMVFAQGQGGRRPPRGGGRFVEMEKAALAEGYLGITADGEVEEGLFPLRATGVSTAEIAEQAAAFLAGLSEQQREKCTFAADDDEWRKWANQHSYPRQGVSYGEMSDAQDALADALLKTSLSAYGFQTTQDIRKLNGTLGELTGRPEEYNEDLYWITIMGDPGGEGPWGWQLDGHHVVINYFILGDQVVMTPHFLGSEPVEAEGGKFAGTVIMQAEQNRRAEFMRSLSAEHQAAAMIRPEKGPTDTLTEAFHDNVEIGFAGLKASELDEAGKAGLLGLIGIFIGHNNDAHAAVKMAEIEEHLDRTYFGWIGGSGDDDVFYYRIHSPVVLIEFDHQRPIGLGRSQVPTRNHIHAVVRTPNGNDYGKDLLRQHYEDEHSHGGEAE